MVDELKNFDMERFNLEEYKKNPNRKLVTRDEREVRIICWDAKNSKPIVALVLTRSVSQREFDELTVSYFNDGTYYGKATEDSLDLFFADKEEESEPSSDDLEEEMIRWHKEHFSNKRDWEKTSGEYLTRKSQLDLANHFAEWQKNHMKEALQTEYEKGRFDMRKEMMKDAREADVIVDRIGEVVYLCPHLSEKTFDKVKIIIIEEE